MACVCDAPEELQSGDDVLPTPRSSGNPSAVHLSCVVTCGEAGQVLVFSSLSFASFKPCSQSHHPAGQRVLISWIMGLDLFFLILSPSVPGSSSPSQWWPKPFSLGLLLPPLSTLPLQLPLCGPLGLPEKIHFSLTLLELTDSQSFSKPVLPSRGPSWPLPCPPDGSDPSYPPLHFILLANMECLPCAGTWGSAGQESPEPLPPSASQFCGRHPNCDKCLHQGGHRAVRAWRGTGCV